ncbi:polysaccharide biosynthesis protein [Pseudooceanicola spongiae]|uniref:polysaccharide biosynthesis protein n=1 Tax=Pseudooceanicola spongiae TaxID=2613965 RepID=UPI001D008B53|nr:nucleoside-diphosphate sugar epimerase/dehydratase [Pseudooceanicola spongiae]
MALRFITRLGTGQKSAILLSLDACIALMSLAGADLLLNGTLPDLRTTGDGRFMLLALLTVLGTSIYLGLHRMKLLAYEKHGIVETGILAASLGASCTLANALPGARLPAEQVLFASLLFLALFVAARLALLRLTALLYRLAKARQRLLIYGAGKTGQRIAAALGEDDGLMPVAFLDDNPRLQSLSVAGLHVYSPMRIKTLVQRLDIDAIVLAVPDEARLRQMQTLSDLPCKTLTLPSLAELLAGKRPAQAPSRIALQDLLGRKRLDLEFPEAGDSYAGKSILITGAGGSIGSELCRQLAALAPARLVLLEHCELALYSIAHELADLHPHLATVPVLGSVCDAPLVRALLAEQGIDTILHAAAYKHVPMVQRNIFAGLRNNVIGTKTLTEAAADAGIDRFILISSDKAVRPTSVMGATKRLAEEIVQDHATRTTRTCFSMVRFGNVIGSSGSVIPLFQDQIARGGPVTVTHPEVSRYFMTVTEAVRLVLTAGSFARGGEVFVLDMGDPVPILQVARQMIRGAGLSIRDADTPEGEIEIRFTGLRAGEKLHEELFIGADMLTTPHDKILRAQEQHLSQIEVASALSEIRRALEARDTDAAATALSKWVSDRARIKATG